MINKKNILAILLVLPILSISFISATHWSDNIIGKLTGKATDSVVTYVSLSPFSLSLQVGQTRGLGPRVTDQYGEVMNGVVTTWSSSNPSVATVNEGLVRGISQGTATITLVVEGKSGTSIVTVSQTTTNTTTNSTTTSNSTNSNTQSNTTTTSNSTNSTTTSNSTNSNTQSNTTSPVPNSTTSNVTTNTTVACNDECSDEGVRQCNGTILKLCGNYDGDSCLEFDSGTTCQSEASCNSGSCDATTTPTASEDTAENQGDEEDTSSDSSESSSSSGNIVQRALSGIANFFVGLFGGNNQANTQAEEGEEGRCDLEGHRCCTDSVTPYCEITNIRDLVCDTQDMKCRERSELRCGTRNNACCTDMMSLGRCNSDDLVCDSRDMKCRDRNDQNCGTLGRICCGGLDGTCSSGLSCDNQDSRCKDERDVQCGKENFRCCADDLCDPNLACDFDGKCKSSNNPGLRCGKLNQQCCRDYNFGRSPTGQAMTSNGIPIAGPRGGVGCFSPSVCDGSTGDGGTCVNACGARGEKCCSGDKCNSPGDICSLTLKCIDKSCGGINQQCCTTGNACAYAGFACEEGKCVGGDSSDNGPTGGDDDEGPSGGEDDNPEEGECKDITAAAFSYAANDDAPYPCSGGYVISKVEAGSNSVVVLCCTDGATK